MTVIFMENCFQILEKNKILESLLKNWCWPARSVSTTAKELVGRQGLLALSRKFDLPEFSSFSNFFILKEILSFSKIWKFWAI